MAGVGVGGGDYRGRDGLDNAKGGGLLMLDGGILDPISFELAGKAPVQSSVSLGSGRLSGVGEAIQEVGR